MNLKENPLFTKLISLELAPDDYAIFGSGPMYPRGLRESIHDIDLIARGSAWEKALTFGKVEAPHMGMGKVIVLFNGDIEIFNAWAPGNWDVDELIDTADEIEGIRFVTLENVLKWKREMNRPKDLVDIEAIENYLKSGGS